MAKRWPDVQEAHIRRTCWASWRISVKPNADTESMYVDVTGISVKEVRITRGDLTIAHENATVNGREKSAEAIVAK